MSLSSTTLLLLQKVGAAAFAADAKLKAEVKDYAQRVHEAMLANPDGQKNDALFANWKIVSRLSQAVATIEEELKKLFETAAALGTPAPAGKAVKPAAAAKRTVKKVVRAPAKAKPAAMPKAVAKAAPKAAPKVVAKAAVTAKVQAVAAPKVKAKVKAKVEAKAKPQVKKEAKAVSIKPAGPVTLGANPTKVLRHLETILNANDFAVISQTAVSKETGIPLGSMTAATKKLMETGHLLAGPSGTFKLANAPAPAL